MSADWAIQRRRKSENVKINQNGGYFQDGVAYSLSKKTEVADAIQLRIDQCYPFNINVSQIAREQGVSRAFVYKIMKEMECEGNVVDPNPPPKQKVERVVCGNLELHHEHFLLALRAEQPKRPNSDYVKQLYSNYGIKISTSSISNFFLKCFEYKGKYKKANLVPLDKFKVVNRARYFEFINKVNMLANHSKWKFFDEKHVANKDTLEGKCRANPLTGQVDCIPVSGDFRETYILAAITCNRSNDRSMVYTMGKENGTAEAFMFFIQQLLVDGWLTYNDVVCLDNARIHTGRDAKHLEALLWDYEREGKPLNIYVVWLPTRSPELNPIEFVFHILSSRIRSLRIQTMAGPCDNEVLTYASHVMNTMPYDLIGRCYRHCGY